MALDFDGVDDKVNYGDIAGVDLAAALTMAFWYQPDTWANLDGIVGKSGCFRLMQRDLGRDLEFNGGLNVWLGKTAAEAFPLGELHHVVLVFDGAGTGNAGRLKLYKDAVELSLTYSGTVATTLPDGGVTDFNVGRNEDNAAFGDFKMGLFMVWTAALTAAEVAQQMNSYRPVRTANLILWGPYNSGTDATDYSGSGNHGTVTGALRADGPPVGGGFPNA